MSLMHFFQELVEAAKLADCVKYPAVVDVPIGHPRVVHNAEHIHFAL